MSNYTINNLEDYKRIYNESVDQSEVFWNDLVLGEGTGRSKKESESKAAYAAMDNQLWM